MRYRNHIWQYEIHNKTKIAHDQNKKMYVVKYDT